MAVPLLESPSHPPVVFSPDDFQVLEIPGFEPRMTALRARLTPKLQAIGEALLPGLEAVLGERLYVHVARHMRRSVNPPSDTWVALSDQPRGYKMVPHVALGLFADRLFVRVGALYECSDRPAFAAALTAQLAALPGDVEVVFDHQAGGGVPVAELRSEPGRIAQAARKRSGDVVAERARMAEDVAGTDVVRLALELLPPLTDVYRAWRLAARTA